MGSRVTLRIMTTHFDRDEPPVIPVVSTPPNDMRPRVVDRAKVKVGRKVSARNRRKR
jgi:hypothetical protein